MIYLLMGYAHAAVARRWEAIRMLAKGERGQGTVEYVGLILLVSLLMVGMVAAMKGFNRSLTKTSYLKVAGSSGGKPKFLAGRSNGTFCRLACLSDLQTDASSAIAMRRAPPPKRLLKRAEERLDG
jgi:Flp pilus assembly pilin Flp